MGLHKVGQDWSDLAHTGSNLACLHAYGLQSTGSQGVRHDWMTEHTHRQTRENEIMTIYISLSFMLSLFQCFIVSTLYLLFYCSITNYYKFSGFKHTHLFGHPLILLCSLFGILTWLKSRCWPDVFSSPCLTKEGSHSSLFILLEGYSFS